MAIYRFKIFWDENEEVERIILIQPEHTFLDFYNILVESFELKNKEVSASFFTSDEYWDKHIEITLRPEDVQGNEKLMSKTTIASMIEQPRQRFVFVYDAQLQLTFNIELIKIESDNILKSDDVLPKVIYSKNKIPNRRKTLQSSKLQANDKLKNTGALLSDDEINQMIINRLMQGDLSEEDILNGKLDDLFKEQKSDAELDEIDEEENEDELFDEEDDVFDNDDFNNDGYYNEDEYEN